MIKEIKECNKRVVIIIKEDRDTPTGYLISLSDFLYNIAIILFLFLFFYFFIIILPREYIQNISIIFLCVLIIRLISYKNLFYFIKYELPDYLIIVKSSKNFHPQNILEHELFHLRIIEKGKNNKDLINFMNQKLDEMTHTLMKQNGGLNKK
jgi:hypothetical protein